MNEPGINRLKSCSKSGQADTETKLQAGLLHTNTAEIPWPDLILGIFNYRNRQIGQTTFENSISENISSRVIFLRTQPIYALICQYPLAINHLKPNL